MIGSILLTHILSAEPAGEHGNEAVEGAHHLGEKIDHLTSVGPWFLTHGYLIFLIPFVSFILILLFGKKLPKGGHEIGIVSILAVLGFAFMSAYQWINQSVEATVYGQSYTWLRIGDLKLDVGTHIDGIAVMMMVVVGIVSTLVHIYSTAYVKNDVRYTHYFAALSLFTASMMLLVVASNTLQLLAGWELVGLCSFMLIGHWWEEKENSNAALKAFFTTRFGDIGLLTGVVMTFFVVSRWAPNGKGTFSILDINNAALSGKVGHTLILLTALALLMGIMGKSGQFPLHTWLPDAMAGPTPVSALIHAATMVVAGVYLAARVYPIFWEGFNIGETMINPMVVVGGITIIAGAVLAFVQKAIKKVLAYSTISQLGYMVMALGAGAWTAAIFHLFTHAFFKALLFLGAGSISHIGSHHSFDMKKDMGGLRKSMPITFWTFMIGTGALDGIFPLAGFWSKDEILANAGNSGYQFFVYVGLVGAMLTAGYMTRCVYLTFFGKYRGHHHPHESPKAITIPLIILSILSIFSGFLYAAPFGIEKFKEWVEPKGAFPLEGLVQGAGAFITHAEFNWLDAGIATGFGLTGILIAYLYYWKKIGLVNLTEKNKIARAGYVFLDKKYFLDILYTDIIVGGIKKQVANVTLWTNDHIINGFVNLVGKTTARLGEITYFKIDQKGIDGIVNGLGSSSHATGSVLTKAQSGKLQRYAIFLFGGVILLTVFVILITK